MPHPLVTVDGNTKETPNLHQSSPNEKRERSLDAPSDTSQASFRSRLYAFDSRTVSARFRCSSNFDGRLEGQTWTEEPSVRGFVSVTILKTARFVGHDTFFGGGSGVERMRRMRRSSPPFLCAYGRSGTSAVSVARGNTKMRVSPHALPHRSRSRRRSPSCAWFRCFRVL